MAEAGRLPQGQRCRPGDHGVRQEHDQPGWPGTAHITDGNNIEVEGSATNHDKFQHDVYFTATLWDADGKAVGTATGKLEDWPAGHHGIYKLVGTSTATAWTRVSVEVSRVTEHVRGAREE